MIIKRNPKVVVYNYNTFKIFPNREVAIKEYENAVNGSEGNERRRYLDILFGLKYKKTITLISDGVYLNADLKKDIEGLLYSDIKVILDYAEKNNISVTYFNE